MLYILFIIITIQGIREIITDIKKLIRMRKGDIREEDFEDFII